VPRLIESLNETHPRITVTTEVLPTPQVLLAVRDGRADAGVARVPAPLDGIRIRPLRRDDEGVLVAATHLLAERETVELRDAADHPVVLHPRSANPAHHDFILELFAARGLRWIPLAERVVVTVSAAGDAGSGLPDQRLRLCDRYAPGWGCLPAESGTGCPAWLDGRFASKSALHPAGRVLTSSQRSWSRRSDSPSPS
jgi:DNA-binding transcriptional LysR family regulator